VGTDLTSVPTNIFINNFLVILNEFQIGINGGDAESGVVPRQLFFKQTLVFVIETLGVNTCKGMKSQDKFFFQLDRIVEFI